MNKTDLKGLLLPELQQVITEAGEKKFRAAQVYSWMYRNGHTSFSDMTDLSVKTRLLFSDRFRISTLEQVFLAQSSDGTAKFLWELEDGKRIESVLIPDDKRLTACVSSQVGCALGCKFCATGKMGLTRNLTSGEIYDQVLLMNRWSLEKRGQPITNIVFMGMGEPLMNLDQVVRSVRLISDATGVAVSQRRITISTAGVAHKIIELADLELNARLAVSLHSAISEKRNEIMPINRGTDLTELGEAIRYYLHKTGQRVTYEYVLFDSFNDTEADAEALVRFCRMGPSKVNIILFNPVSGTRFRRAGTDRLNQFVQYLADRHITVMVRQSRGQDIDAACGQLATTKQKELIG
ncbi:MAG: 23S rRNA (adenine(2503)-C(2))-methyltransferase RlmN [Bacteroidetes bacterium]|nr:23S rRNA (adenine(2503)-C(2))-methyltransferase RlmN [Bacteroidota bacterium]